MSEKRGPFLIHLDGFGPSYVMKDPRNDQVLMRSATAKTCPKCQGYMQQILVDAHVAHKLKILGRWRCIQCSWIPSLEIYDEMGVKMDRELWNRCLATMVNK